MLFFKDPFDPLQTLSVFQLTLCTVQPTFHMVQPTVFRTKFALVAEKQMITFRGAGPKVIKIKK